MPMIPFMERFPDLAARETRCLTIFGRSDIPDGEYAFLELFCDEPGCDCRRVMIAVLRSDTELNKIWASINYGWESIEFYKQWGGSWVTDADAKGPFLDPLNPKTPYSPVLLNLFRFLVQSPDYVRRIQTHYEIFRQTVEEARSGTLYGTPYRQRSRHSKTRR